MELVQEQTYVMGGCPFHLAGMVWNNVGVVTILVTVGRIGGWTISPIRASLYAQYLSI